MCRRYRSGTSCRALSSASLRRSAWPSRKLKFSCRNLFSIFNLPDILKIISREGGMGDGAAGLQF